jgi:hypothetical protein
MINTIKKYLRVHSNVRFNDCWYKDTLIDMIKTSSEVASYEILCFDRKKNLSFHKKCFHKKLHTNTNEILRSHMVIIRTYLFEKNIVMKMLGQICKDNNCFGPILLTGDNDILFFPKLRYQDGYLLKSIVEKHLGNKNFCIAYGSNNLVII